MQLKNRLLPLNFFKIIDLFLLCCAFLVAAVFSHNLTSPDKLFGFLLARISAVNGLSLFALFILWHFVFSAFGSYNSRRISSFVNDIYIIVKACSVCTLSLVFVHIILPIHIFNLTFINIFWITAIELMAVLEITLQLVQWYFRKKGRNLRHMLIAGTNERACKIASQICHHPSLGYDLKGFIDNKWHGPKDCSCPGKPAIVADFNSISEYLRHNIVDSHPESLAFCLKIPR